MGSASRNMIDNMNDIVWAVNPKNDFEITIQPVDVQSMKKLTSLLTVQQCKGTECSQYHYHLETKAIFDFETGNFLFEIFYMVLHYYITLVAY